MLRRVLHKLRARVWIPRSHVGVAASLKFHPGKVETEDRQSKLAGKTSRFFKLWV